MSEHDRLEELEIRYTHLEQLVNEPSEVVYRQQQEFEALRQLTTRLNDRVGNADPGIVDPAQNEPPPHS